MIARSSIDLCAAFLHQGAPARVLGLQEVGKALRRPAQRLAAFGVQLGDRLRLLERFLDLGVEPLDELIQRSLSAVGIVRATLCKPSRGPTSLISTDAE